MHGVETGRSRGWTVARHQHSPAFLAFPRSSVRIDGERDGPKSATGTVLNENSEGLGGKKVFIVKVLLDPFWSQLQRGAADLSLRVCALNVAPHCVSLSSWHVSDCVQFAVRTVDYHHLDWQ